MLATERFPTLRQSRLATFDRCSLSSFFEEEYRHDWSGHPQARGQIIHRVFARALKTMHEQGENTIPTDAMVELLEDELRQAAVEDRDFLNIPFEEVKDMRWVVVKWAADNAFEIENLVDVEHRLQATVRYPSDDGPVERIVTGQLDAAFVAGEQDEEMIVIDYKDSWALPGPTELGFDGYFQQRFYAFLIFSNYRQIEKVTLKEAYVRYSETRDATVWRHDIEDVEREIAALVERFDRAWTRGVFPPAPGRHCNFCPRPAACPIFPGVRVEGSITDQAKAHQFAQEALVAKAAYEQRVKALKAWASVHGSVPISDHKGKRAWGHRPISRTSRPDKETLERAIREGTLTPDRLEELYETRQGTRFEPHTPAAVDEHPADQRLYESLQRSVEQQSVTSNETGSET